MPPKEQSDEIRESPIQPRLNPMPKVALIVAHPDDEVLWAGGTILSHSSWNCFILSLCRKNDPDRAPKYFRVLDILKAEGTMADLDDGPEQKPITNTAVQQEILYALPEDNFDIVITHDPRGEYTRHRRHEEVGKAVITLWHERQIKTKQLWTFAYEDGNRAYYPRAVPGTEINFELSPEIYKTKSKLMTDIYGFLENSWEVQTTPKTEAFHQFSSAEKAVQWLNMERVKE